MNYKRITLLCGHYGSGKTNIALSLAYDLKKQTPNVAIADVDIVNPYFRTKDSEDELKAAEIKLICSEYASTNIDIPALPQEMYSITDDKSLSVIIDVGGDDRGALALGRLAPEIVRENNYDMIFVINMYRPLTRDAASTLEVMHEIENTCGIKFTSIVNNSNLGEDTRAEDFLSSVEYANEVSRLTGLVIKLNTIKKSLYDELKDKVPNLFILNLQKKFK